MVNYKNILFDLDGTLTDPKIGITKSVQYALAKFEIYEEDLDNLIPFIGPPLYTSFTEMYSFSEEKAQQAIEFYREYFRVKGIFENVLYSGIEDLLKQLKSQGKVLMVATSKPQVFAKQILEHFQIEKYFDHIYGSELDGTRADKIELIEYIMQQHGLEKDETLMIGDRKYDIVGAKNNGIHSMGVCYGYGTEEELSHAQPEYICKTIKDVIELFS